MHLLRLLCVVEFKVLDRRFHCIARYLSVKAVVKLSVAVEKADYLLDFLKAVCVVKSEM